VSKKDYIKAAEIVRRMRKTDLVGAMMDAFVELFTGDNPQFDERRFRDACRKD